MKQKSTEISANYIKESLTAPFILKSDLHVLGLKQDHVTNCWLWAEESTVKLKTLLHSYQSS